MAAAAIAVPSMVGDDNKPTAHKAKEISSKSTVVGVTRTYRSQKGLLLTAGGVGPSGRGKVFAQLPGVNDLQQSWNLLRDKIITRGGSSSNQLRCLETNREGNLFTASCVTGKASQEWAHKVVDIGDPGFPDTIIIQNFATKKCVTAGAPTGRGTSATAAQNCTGAANQKWTQGRFVR
ncbi:RICIN domain-containing protein [Streptomyces sp. NBC_00568]|uniref:RICIN domain-containing protein n=1 Tax=Streptomyces sp. NBC_00568 TaxID=2975779 RepID=UPI0022594DEC|nr:RICIN domain-containing protein [Streptomyces sp. NBC_00568]MCX4993612.1 ricin-type beta-trefoil lectin domain protein [Streptomyces sp. NBC_00568]